LRSGLCENNVRQMKALKLKDNDRRQKSLIKLEKRYMESR
jgi:hypothetical protein